MIRAFFLLVALSAATCQSGAVPQPGPAPDPAPTPPPKPVPASDAGPVDGGVIASCTAACAWFAQHKCKQAQPTASGASCVDVCVNVENSGVMSLGPGCVVHAAKCEDADACAYSARRK